MAYISFLFYIFIKKKQKRLAKNTSSTFPVILHTKTLPFRYICKFCVRVYVFGKALCVKYVKRFLRLNLKNPMEILMKK